MTEFYYPINPSPLPSRGEDRRGEGSAYSGFSVCRLTPTLALPLEGRGRRKRGA